MKYVTSIILGCLLCLGIAISAQDSRVVSSQYLATTVLGSSYSTVPSAQTHPDIRTSNTITDANDPLHPCYGNDTIGSIADNAGSYSVFTRIVHPGGELFVSTAGSNYDTVASVFKYVDAGLPLGAALACNDDSNPSVTTTSFIDINLPAGQYLIMVSRFSTASAGSPLTLGFSIGLLPSGSYPANDAVTSPTSLTTHQATTQTDIHFAVDDAMEQNLNASCEMYNSVWYSYTAPTFGEYQFTTQGSRMLIRDASSYLYGTKVGIYSSYYNPDTAQTEYNLVGCHSRTNYNTVTSPIYMSPGYTYLIRVGMGSNLNIQPGSRYRIKPVVTHVTVTTNDGFDDGLTGWKATKFEAGDGESNGSVLIASGVNKKTLSQTKTSFPNYIKWAKGGVLMFYAGYSYVNNVPSGKFTVTITYSDGRPKTVVNIPFSNTNGGYLNYPIELPSAKVKSVKVMATVNPGSGTSMSINFMGLDYDRDPSVARSATLPFPTAP